MQVNFPGSRRIPSVILLVPVLAACCWGSTPVLQFSTSILRTNSVGDYAQGVAADAAGNTYVAGTTNTFSLSSTNTEPDAFVAKLDPTGNVLWTVYFGGSGYDSATSIALDTNGNIYVAGVTYSSDFPIMGSIQGFQGGSSCTGTVIAGCADAFVVKMDPTGAILYATLLGGTGDDQANGIAVDGNGNMFVTGSTNSSDFPTQNPIQSALGGATDAFVTEINAAGNALVYSTYLGGSLADQGNGITLDTLGNVYVAGQTSSINFPTKNALQAANAGSQDCFITKVNAAGTALVFSTYFGGASADTAGGIAVDSAQNVYLAVNTSSADFPITNLISPLTPPPACCSGVDVGALVAVKLNAAGTAYLYSTSVEYSTTAGGIAVDSTGNASITGTSVFLDRSFFGYAGVMVILNATGSAITSTTDAGGLAVATDPNGNISAAGYYQVPSFTTAVATVSRISVQSPTNCTFFVTSVSQSFNPYGGAGSATISASAPTCVPAVTSDSAWLTISTANSTTVSFNVASDYTASRAGTLTIAGHAFTITQTVPATSLPTSVSPSTGSASQQTFTATYNNASSIVSVYIMLSTAVQPQSSCFAEYDVTNNQFILIADNGFSISPISPGSGSISNSQCTLNGVGAAAATVGNNLSVTFPLSFTSGYAGTKKIFLFAESTFGLNSGWLPLGSFTVTSGGSGSSNNPVPVCSGAGTPCVVSLTPSNGGGLSGSFTGVFTRATGGPDLYLGYILFLPSPNIVQYTATGSCLVEYNSISNAMRLINNAGTDWLPGVLGIPLSQGGTLTNNFCTLDVTHSSAVVSGDTMSVTAAVTFNAGFSGELGTFLQGFDVTGAFTGMTQFGNWMASGGARKPGPYTVGISPTTGAGSSATLTFTAGDTRGVSALSFVTMLISPVIVGAPACQAFYFPSSNTINLVNDAGSAMVSTTGIAPGTAGTLSNSLCSISTGTASSTTTSNNVTVTLPVTFDAGTFGGAKNIYLNAFDDFGDLSDWVSSATWTVQ